MLELKTLVDKCKGELDKPAAAKCMEYVDLSKDIKKTKDLKQTLDSLLSISKLRNKPYFPLPLNNLNHSIENIKVTFETFSSSELNQLFDKNEIVKADQDKMLLISWVSEANNNLEVKFDLLWKGTVDGFSAATFHSKCDDEGPTLTVILSDKGKVFGGYTRKNWRGKGRYIGDLNAFIFSLTHKRKYTNRYKSDHSIYSGSNYGPIFGSGNDIYIHNNINGTSSGSSNGNVTYQLPPDVDPKTHLAGSNNFNIKEIEVYSVTIL